MASAPHDADEEPDSDDLRIVLLGVSGEGKSSIGNAILGRDVFKEIRTRESETQRGRVEDRNISIIDTPGFFNPHLTDEELKKQMMKSLYLSDPGPHVFLLVINLETFKEDERNIVEQIQENFGEESLLFTMVLFIGREKISKRKCTQIIANEETQKILNNFNGRFHVMNSKSECDPNQITKLLKIIDEMVTNNRGQHYSNEIYLKNQVKLREQKERVKYKEKRQKQEEEITKLEQMWKRHTEEKKRQEERDAWKQGEGTNQEEEIKTKSKEEGIKYHDERNKEDVKVKDQHLKAKEDLRQQMESRREKEREKTPEHSKLDLRIVILGKSDVGKTATANTILGRDAFRAGAQSGTLTCEKQEAVVSGRSISIIDTPALLDALWYKHFQHELKRDIEECLEMSLPGPHVFLLVIRLNSKNTEKEKDTVKWIQENFGEDAIRHTVVLFTHVDFLMNESLDQYIRKSPDLQSLTDSCGGRFHSFNNQDRNNQNQVSELLEKIDQLVKDNGGKHYTNEMSQRSRKQDEKRQNCSEEDKERKERLQGLGTDLLVLMMNLELSKMALTSSLERAITHNLSKRDLRIVLLGLLASGKSSTGNTILNRDAFSAGLMTTTSTSEKQEAVVFERTISIIDTPGPLASRFFMNIQDHDQYEIEKSLGMSAPGPHVFLLVINLLRFRREKNSVKWFVKNLEKDALNRTIILFTHEDLLNIVLDEPLNEYIEKNNELKSLIDSCGGRYHSFDNDEMQNRLQVIELLMKIDEMMEKNGGGHYTKHNIFKRKQDDSVTCEIQ